MNNNILPNFDKTTYESHFLGQRSLPFIFHKDTLLHDCKECPPNLHLNVELLYFVEGSGCVVCDGTPFAVQPGDLVVINSHAVHRVTTPETVKYYCLIVDNDFCTASLMDLSGLRFAPLIQNNGARELFEQVVHEYDSSDAFRSAAIQCAVQQLVLFLCRNYSTQKPTGRRQDEALKSVWTAVEYMKQHLGEKLTVEQIAASAGFSKFYFLRLFKDRTGYTVTHYLNLLRCDRAKQLLLSGSTVKEAASQCGFENFSYFTKVYKDYTGCLPRETLKQK